MNTKFSKLTHIFFIGCMTLCLLPQATFAMDQFEQAAEEATRATPQEKRFHFHAHNYMVHGGNADGASYDALTLQQLMTLGAQRGVVQGTSQVVASLIVELTQLSILKGVEYYYSPNAQEKKALLKQQREAAQMAETQSQLTLLQDTLSKNSSMVTTLVDGATQLNEAQAKKMASLALMKYAAQVNLLLDIQNATMLGIPSEGLIPAN